MPNIRRGQSCQAPQPLLWAQRHQNLAPVRKWPWPLYGFPACWGEGGRKEEGAQKWEGVTCSGPLPAPWLQGA